MANVKKKWVAFKGNSTIPAAMAGEKENLKVQSSEPVQVLAFYADSVVQDGIAEYSDASAKASPKKSNAADETLQSKVVQLEKDLKTADGKLVKADEEITSLKRFLQDSTEVVQRLRSELAEGGHALARVENQLKEADLKIAQTAVTGAQATLDAAEGTDGADAARAALLAAQEALSALQD